MRRCRRIATVGLLLLLSPGLGAAADWPQWQGPDRDAKSKETGLLKSWPKEGPHQVWKADKLGAGFGTPSVADGMIFGTGVRETKDGKKDCVWALKEADGSELWSTPIDDPGRHSNQNNGVSGTPTYDAGKLYAVSSKGKLVRLDAKTGEINWTVDMVKDYRGKIPDWGYTESPLIDGDRVIATPGNETTLVALDKSTAKEVWKTTVPKAGVAQYASATKVEIAGRKQYVQFLKGGVVSVDVADGTFLWRYDTLAGTTANCSTPVVSGDLVYAAAAYDRGGGAARITKSGDAFEAKELYFEHKYQNHHGGVVLVDGYLYGECSGKLGCVELATGKQAWVTDKVQKGSTTYADGHLYCRNERGADVILVEANPKQFVEKGRFTQSDRSGKQAWPHPVIANGKLYLRDQDVLLCYNLSATKN